MLIRLVIMALALMPFMPSVEAASPQLIRVLLVHDQPGAVIEVKGKYKIYDPRDFSHISSRYGGQRRYIQALQDGIRWGEEFPGIYQLMIVPDNQYTTTIVDGIEYRGSIYVYDIGGTISVVNDVYVEDYIQSLLAPKYREMMPDEALAAIAIAARTSVYYQAHNPKNKFWDVDGRQAGYQGYASTNLNSPIEKAIHATRYLIMTLPDSLAQAAPFAAQWEAGSEPGKKAQISLIEAQSMAKNGSHAAQILSKAFPGTTLLLMHSEAPTKVASIK